MSRQHDTEIVSQRQITRRTIVAFAIFFGLLGCGYAGWRWLYTSADADGVQKPLRAGLQTNEKVFSGLFSDKHHVKTYPASEAASKVRLNGNIGLSAGFDASSWRLQVVRATGDTLLLTLADIKALPKTEITFDFKCIEGWSQVTRWGGVRFSDFIDHYHLTTEAAKNYVGLVTPDKQYYVGIDMASMLQDQTILCYEQNGKTLPMNNGYPLRLIIPVKYGIKHLKRIGTMTFSNTKPADYWAEQGYDYYSGL